MATLGSCGVTPIDANKLSTTTTTRKSAGPFRVLHTTCPSVRPARHRDRLFGANIRAVGARLKLQKGDNS
jgi:hypothetical protein